MVRFLFSSTFYSDFIILFFSNLSLANDEHLKPFSDACKKYNIHDTPLTPYLDEELIKEAAIAIDGNAITKIGFKYDHPTVTADSLREVMNDFIKKGFFPKELM